MRTRSSTIGHYRSHYRSSLSESLSEYCNSLSSLLCQAQRDVDNMQITCRQRVDIMQTTCRQCRQRRQHVQTTCKQRADSADSAAPRWRPLATWRPGDLATIGNYWRLSGRALMQRDPRWAPTVGVYMHCKRAHCVKGLVHTDHCLSIVSLPRLCTIICLTLFL